MAANLTAKKTNQESSPVQTTFCQACKGLQSSSPHKPSLLTSVMFPTVRDWSMRRSFLARDSLSSFSWEGCQTSNQPQPRLGVQLLLRVLNYVVAHKGCNEAGTRSHTFRDWSIRRSFLARDSLSFFSCSMALPTSAAASSSSSRASLNSHTCHQPAS